jgi:hypothetical protein
MNKILLCEKPGPGRTRIINKFLLFPKKLPFRNYPEICSIKWFRKANIFQECCWTVDYTGYYKIWHWRNASWADHPFKKGIRRSKRTFKKSRSILL